MFNGDNDEWFFSRSVNTDNLEFSEENLYDLKLKLILKAKALVNR